MLRQHEHKLLSTRTNTNNNRRKQEHSQTNTDTEDRRQGHHNSLEPITVGPHDTIIVKTPDTDVFLLCIAMRRTIGKNLFVMAGTGNRFRITDTSGISDALGEELCSCLPGFHAFSGT